MIHCDTWNTAPDEKCIFVLNMGFMLKDSKLLNTHKTTVVVVVVTVELKIIRPVFLIKSKFR